MIRNIIETSSNLNKLFESIELNKKISILNLGEGEVLGILDEIDRPKLFVVSDDIEADYFYQKLIGMKKNVIKCTNIPNLLLTEIGSNEIEYINFFQNLYCENIDVYIVTPNVLMLPVAESIINTEIFAIRVDMNLSPQEFIQKLSDLGYRRVEVITSAGEFACRGEVVDFAILGTGIGYRVSFDYDIIEKIKRLDEQYISSVESCDEIPLSANKYLNIDKNLVIKSIKSDDKLLKLFEEYIEYNKDTNSLWFLPYSQDKFVPIFMCLNENFVIIYSDAKKIYDSSVSILKEYDKKISEAIKDNLLPKKYINPLRIANIQDATKRTNIAFHYINNANRIFAPNQVFTFKSVPNINYAENYETLILDLQNNNKLGYTTIVFVDDNNHNILIKKLYGKLDFIECKSIINLQKNTVNIFNKEYNNSYNFFDEKVCVIGSNNIGKKYDIDKIDFKKIKVNTIEEIELPKQNDYVVHKIHGIGKCLGIETLELSKDNRKEYVIIEYKNADKLYLPIENVDSISKYIGDDENPTLNKLGGAEFKKIKDKVKASVKDIANDLIAIYKKRQETKGFKYPEDDDIQIAFEKTFQHKLTIDQENTLVEIKNEMCSGKLIDRLVCGDVGFGKTEVAIRIAFKTLLAGKTVAVLCPTTILSEQHYNTFNSRMKEFGINVAVLNRFKTLAEVNQIITDLREGKINVIIGTHKLLNNNIQLRNLGLLVIDEEQKFGVEHKEKLKSLKKDVNVVTLSATPIPRTLHISLSGIRDISTIQTPPSNKQSTQVNVLEFNNASMKMAIDRELNRDGQVLVIYNRVDGIESIADYIRKLVNNDDIIVDVAHGQMTSNVLENKIMSLYSGKTQILVATTLIENGVDLPNANTLIVLDSDKLGLSQLYQLKGRVGRGNRDSFAYFMYNTNLTDIAYKRLKAISEFTAMGSGFKIAMRDMELRGAGNIFGSQQHGHLTKIGYAMYMSILNSAIDELKNNNVDNSLYHEIRIETDLDTTIPHNSRFTTNQKMLLYTKIAQIKTQEHLEKVVNEINDIYGEIPKSLFNLCQLSLIKNSLYKYKALKLIVKKTICKIEFDKNIDINSLKNLLNEDTKIEIDKNNISININMDYDKCLDYISKILNVV